MCEINLHEKESRVQAILTVSSVSAMCIIFPSIIAVLPFAVADVVVVVGATAFEFLFRRYCRCHAMTIFNSNDCKNRCYEEIV